MRKKSSELPSVRYYPDLRAKIILDTVFYPDMFKVFYLPSSYFGGRYRDCIAPLEPSVGYRILLHRPSAVRYGDLKEPEHLRDVCLQN